MKIILTALIVFFFLNGSAHAKCLDPADTSHTQKYRYCVLQGMLKMMSVKEIITVDFGDAALSGSDADIYKAIEEKVKTFSSKVDALNYLNGFGWEFVSGYSSAVTSGMVQYWMLRKAKE